MKELSLSIRKCIRPRRISGVIWPLYRQKVHPTFYFTKHYHPILRCWMKGCPCWLDEIDSVRAFYVPILTFLHGVSNSEAPTIFNFSTLKSDPIKFSGPYQFRFMVFSHFKIIEVQYNNKIEDCKTIP